MPNFKHIKMGEFSSQNLSIFSLLFLVGFLIYLPTLWAPFQLDDYVHIVRNGAIKHLPDLRPILNDDPFRLVAHFSFALNYWVGGIRVGGYHTVNILIHVANAFLLFLISNLLVEIGGFSKKPDSSLKQVFAVMMAFLFLVHPIQTEAVSYTVQRAASLATFFFLCSIYFYLRSRLQKSSRIYACALLSATLSMLTKQIAIVLPVVIFLIEMLFFKEEKNSFKARVKLILPFLLISFIIPALYLYRFGITTASGLLMLTQETFQISRFSYLLTQIRVLATYIRLILLPIHQNFDYQYPVYTRLFDPQVLPAFILETTLFAGWFYMLRREKIIQFGILFFGSCMIVESSIFPLPDVIFEHRLYLPMAGFLLAFTGTLLILFQNEKRLKTVGIVIVCALSFLTWSRNRVWGDPILLMSDTVSKSPEKARPNNNLGYFYLQNKDYEKAKPLFEKAIRLDPEYGPAYQNLGVIYYEKNDFEKALSHFEKAAKFEEAKADSYLYLGHIAYQKKKWNQAEAFYRRALEINSSFSSAYNGLANSYLARDDWHNAYLMVKRSQYANPDNAYAYYILGTIDLLNGWQQEAIQDYEKALLLDPGLTAVHNSLGNLYYQLRNLDMAENHFQAILSLDVRSERAYFNLANVYHEMGDYEKAEEYAEKALKLAKENGNEALIHKIESNKKKEALRSLKTAK